MDSGGIMKKFDVFLLIIACGLIGFGYYFSKEFKSDSEYSSSDFALKNSNRSSASTLKSKRNRLPSQENKSEQKKEMPEAENKKTVEQKYIEKYVYLKKCIMSQNCDFSQEDPRSYELEIYKAINEHLKEIDAVSPAIKNKILLSAAKLPDGYVKDSVLKEIMKNQIYSSEWRDVVLDEYISHYDALLIPDVVAYLKENSSEQDLELVHQRIFREITNGSPKVANALAENLKQLLNDKSASFYKAKISNLEEGPIKSNLMRELTDFEMTSSAG
jgi:hypothetical protein